MTHVRDILNEIKWTKDLEKVKIWYIHRGALNNTKIISGIEITGIGRSFLETSTATIPYHRIIKILYGEKTVFDRWELRSKDKQL
ncbi:MAG: DUF504 domain-containing protein [Thermoplasmata archaeon]|nr:DUF504 domain-containing protein [Thermoplasmata archaeon]MBE3137727.1 DUF504 domain-containing protein [Thermoplasmata archaeon]MBE3141831.1 DUF504 domain-containing protein [Thermoplasmata archaeon]